jgi:hypothetical protein
VSDIAIKTTAFITCLLAVTRTLFMVRPLLKIETLQIMVLVVLFVLFELLIVSLAFSRAFHYEYYWYELAAMPTILTVITAISGLVSLQSLLLKIGSTVASKRNVEISVTILILAGMFCACNIPFCVILIRECILRPGSLYGSVHNYDIFVSVYSLSVPLNSAINPVVYFSRNSKLRAHVMNKLCCGHGGHSEGGPSTIRCSSIRGAAVDVIENRIPVNG